MQVLESGVRPDDVGPTTSERLLDVTLRYGSRRAAELPWHLLLHLAQATERDEMKPAGFAAGRDERSGLARAIGFALANALEDEETASTVERLARWLPSLWRLDSRFDLAPLAHVPSFLSALRGQALLDTVGELLLRWLADADESADDDGPLEARDLVSIGAIPVDPDGDRWSVLLHGMVAHVRGLLGATGPAGVGRWIRLCSSRSALRYLAAQPEVRGEPVLLATLLLHGGEREIAVGFAALHGADPSAPVRSVVAGLVGRDRSLSARRAGYLFARLSHLSRPEPELRDALLRHTIAPLPQAERVPPAAVDATLDAGGGYLEAAILGEANAPAAARAEALDRLLTHVTTRLAGATDGAAEDGSRRWAPVMAEGLAHEARTIGPGRGLRQRVIRTLSDAELTLSIHTPDDVLPRDGLLGLCTLALHLARRLPDSAWGQSFALALYELALRLRLRHDERFAGEPAFAALEPILGDAPDLRDETHLAAVEGFLRRWRDRERGVRVTLPPPESARVLRTEALGIAQAH